MLAGGSQSQQRACQRSQLSIYFSRRLLSCGGPLHILSSNQQETGDSVRPQLRAKPGREEGSFLQTFNHPLQATSSSPFSLNL